MSKYSDTIISAFSSIRIHYGFTIVKIKDEKQSGSLVVFSNGPVRLTVDYDTYAKECDAMFELRQANRNFKASLYLIFIYVSRMKSWLLRAENPDELKATMETLADQVKTYAAKALEGDAKFYEQLERFNATLQ